MSQNGRSKVVVDGHGSKLAIIRLKVDRPNESKDKCGWSKNVKMNGLNTFKSDSGRSSSMKKNGLKVLKFLGPSSLISVDRPLRI